MNLRPVTMYYFVIVQGSLPGNAVCGILGLGCRYVYAACYITTEPYKLWFYGGFPEKPSPLPIQLTMHGCMNILSSTLLQHSSAASWLS